MTGRLSAEQATQARQQRAVKMQGWYERRGDAVGLRTKFNLVMITAFLIGLAIATFLAREITTEEAKRQMLNEATLIMRSGTAVRGYTQNEIRPLIIDQMAVRFLPHSVPS